MALKINIKICGMTNTPTNPWLVISSGQNNGSSICIGWYHQARYTSGHYQSVLPVEVVNVESTPVVSHEDFVADPESSQVSDVPDPDEPKSKMDEDLLEVFHRIKYQMFHRIWIRSLIMHMN